MVLLKCSITHMHVCGYGCPHVLERLHMCASYTVTSDWIHVGTQELKHVRVKYISQVSYHLSYKYTFTILGFSL